MKSLIFFVLLLIPGLLLAEEPNVAELEKINIKVVRHNGLIDELQVFCDGYTNSEYELIGKLSGLKSISFSGKQLNDEQLKMLSGLKDLEYILINGSELTDEGYRGFLAFPKLKKLSLFHPSREQVTFTGKGLAHLKDHPRLTQLTFAGATAGNEAFAAISQITQLELFREWHNTETSAELEYLTKLENLKTIRLGQRLPNWGKKTPASFDNKTLALLAKMPSLEVVELTEARLDYDGLAQLKSLPKLKKIIISQVDVSATDIEKLKAELPHVEIDWKPLTEAQAKMLSKNLKI
ncbi:hypothetical protein DTL42_20590 [Bremerella cremea]|uniref:Leucine Rich repeats (2 copies) n=1 Tax=Bremerella cremea TaxID=1031537 RepID=A0A368KLX6_9BACT|nr:hypothetical protein [Bremerella cremea]RCS42226.1 hypothetical protein DTL42_20590 [Bremerella cremea]